MSHAIIILSGEVNKLNDNISIIDVEIIGIAINDTLAQIERYRCFSGHLQKSICLKWEELKLNDKKYFLN